MYTWERDKEKLSELRPQVKPLKPSTFTRRLSVAREHQYGFENSGLQGKRTASDTVDKQMQYLTHLFTLSAD